MTRRLVRDDEPPPDVSGYWLGGNPAPFADQHPELPGTMGLRPIEGGIGESVTGEALMRDRWIQQAMARMRARRARKEG